MSSQAVSRQQTQRRAGDRLRGKRIKSVKEIWLPLVFQSIAFLGAAWTYSNAMEHRITVLEENLKAQANSQVLMQKQLDILQQSLLKLTVIEEVNQRREVLSGK